MKKLWALALVALLGFAMIGCDVEEETTTEEETVVTTETPELPETISMADVDDYLFDPAWQFVDFRNFDDQMADGWIRGFEIIPFFQYLEYENILVRLDGWTFTPETIKNEAALRALFDEDLNIVLICAAGVRSGFVKSALLHLGYENVWNAGGLRDYDGEHRVYGDGSFTFTLPPREHIDPLPADINMDNIDLFLGRPGTKFFDFRDVYPEESAPKLETGWIDGFTFVPYIAFLEAHGILEVHRPLTEIPEDLDDIINEEFIYVLKNIFGDYDTELILMCQSGARSGMMKAILEHLGYENVWNAGGWMHYDGDHGIYPWHEDECPENGTPENGTPENGNDCD